MKNTENIVMENIVTENIVTENIVMEEVEIRIQNTKGRLIEKYLLKILNKTKLVKKNTLIYYNTYTKKDFSIKRKKTQREKLMAYRK